MKSICTFFIGFGLCMFCIYPKSFCQVPEAINYQAVARDAGGNLLSNQMVSFKLSIRQGSFSGTIVYSEIHLKTTSSLGLAILEIGRGTVVSGSFSAINWGIDSYYLQTEMDPAGGTSYSLSGTSQFLSVPYALYSKNGVAPGQNPGEMLYWNGSAWVTLSPGTYGQTLTFCNGVPSWGGCLPIVTTTTVSSIGTSNAASGGNVTSDGGSTVTARGVCWNTSSNPTTANSHTSDGSGTGIFVSTLTILIPNTQYYVRAYATNSIGTAYGNEEIFTTIPWICGLPITDTRDTKVYSTVLIGTQCWFAQNLNVGTKLNVTENQTNNSIIEKYCYNNADASCDVYGGLYQWAETVQYLNGATNTASWTPVPTGNVQGICPGGWHIPSDAEWTTLSTFLGGESVAGGKLKEAGIAHWASPNSGATNSSGFTALPGGNRNAGGWFENLSVLWDNLDWFGGYTLHRVELV